MMNQPDGIINGKSIANLRGKITRHIMMFKPGTAELSCWRLGVHTVGRAVTVNSRTPLRHLEARERGPSSLMPKEQCFPNPTSGGLEKKMILLTLSSCRIISLPASHTRMYTDTHTHTRPFTILVKLLNINSIRIQEK